MFADKSISFALHNLELLTFVRPASLCTKANRFYYIFINRCSLPYTKHNQMFTSLFRMLFPSASMRTKKSSVKIFLEIFTTQWIYRFSFLFYRNLFCQLCVNSSQSIQCDLYKRTLKGKFDYIEDSRCLDRIFYLFSFFTLKCQSFEVEVMLIFAVGITKKIF